MKKLFSILFLSILWISMISSCGNSGNTQFDENKAISVISREDGSGTRSAFIELFGIEVKNDDGSKKDMTTKEAIIAKQTDVMMTNIASDEYSIGYISLGSLNDTVKALQVDGVDASSENVKNQSYSVYRPFNIATKGEPKGLTKDFIDFILSADGQAVVSKTYIPINDNAQSYNSDNSSGKITIAGSSSVSPLMEKLIEAYKAINPNAEIELQTNDSSAGLKATIDGICDIGMASRELKDSEKSELTSVQIALDGLAVIVNKNNSTSNLTKEQIKSIFTGEVLKWNEVQK